MKIENVAIHSISKLNLIQELTLDNLTSRSESVSVTMCSIDKKDLCQILFWKSIDHYTLITM